jgi:hypothetical protein
MAAHSLALVGSQVKSQSNYGRQSVDQSVLLSNPICGLRPDFVTVGQLRFCRYGAPSLTRGRVSHCHGHNQEYITSVFAILLAGTLHSQLLRVRFLVDRTESGVDSTEITSEASFTGRCVVTDASFCHHVTICSQ